MRQETPIPSDGMTPAARSSIRCSFGFHKDKNQYPDRIHDYLRCGRCGRRKVVLGSSYEEIPTGWMEAAKYARDHWWSKPDQLCMKRPPPITPRPDPPKGLSNIQVSKEKRIEVATKAYKSGLMTRNEARKYSGLEKK